MKQSAFKGNSTTNKRFISTYLMKRGYSKTHEQRIKLELRAAGAVLYDMWLPETKSLPFVIHEDEHIKGVVFGRYEDGTGALIATDKRVIFIDKKFLFVKFDEISYNVVSAVSQGYIGPSGTVTLHTRLGDYKLHTFNLKSAMIFSEYIDRQCLENKMEI